MTWLSRLIGALVLILSVQGARAAAPSDPSGTWLTQDGRARVRVEKCGAAQDRVCGSIVWLRGATGTSKDTNNPDQRKATRPLLGHQMLLGLRPNQEARYAGKVYNAEDGKTYDVNVWLERSGKLQVEGCLMSFLCRTETWTRVTDMAPGQLAGATGAPDGPRLDPEWAPKTTGSTSPAPPPAGAPRR